MVFKRRLNLYIKVEGLGFGHYNIHVNFKFYTVCNGLEFQKLTPIAYIQILPIMANTNNTD
jgi:hypothetical protein